MMQPMARAVRFFLVLLGLSAALLAVAAADASPAGRAWSQREIDLSLAGLADVIYGAPDKDQLGNDLATGDVNSDGIADILLGAHLGSPPGRNNAGRAYVILGGPGWPAVRDLASAGAADWSFLGPGLEPRLGSAVALGDVGGGPGEDIVLGSLLADPPDPADPNRTLANAGAVYIVHGQAQAGGQRDLATRPPDSLLVGDHRAGAEQLGTALAVADLNADGRRDLVAAAALRRTQTGGVYVRYGPIASRVQYLANQPADWTLLGPGVRATFGTALAVGDLSGDGIADLVVSGAYAAPGEIMDTGAVHVFFGQDQGGRRGTTDLAKELGEVTLEGEPGALIGVALNLGVRSCSGQALAIDDLTGDGQPDLVIGAPSADGRRGQVLLLAGPLSPGRSDATAAVWRLSGRDTEGRLGWSVATGHLDADRQTDLVVAAPWASPQGRSSAGRVYGFRGPLVKAADSSADLVPDLVLQGPEAYAGNAGISLALADSSGDGLDDLHLGFPDAAPLGRRSVGAVYRVAGPLLPDVPTAEPTGTPSAIATSTATASATARATTTEAPTLTAAPTTRPPSSATGTATASATVTARPSVHPSSTPPWIRGPAFLPLAIQRR